MNTLAANYFSFLGEPGERILRERTEAPSEPACKGTNHIFTAEYELIVLGVIEVSSKLHRLY